MCINEKIEIYDWCLKIRIVIDSRLLSRMIDKVFMIVYNNFVKCFYRVKNKNVYV